MCVKELNWLDGSFLRLLLHTFGIKLNLRSVLTLRSLRFLCCSCRDKNHKETQVTYELPGPKTQTFPMAKRKTSSENWPINHQLTDRSFSHEHWDTLKKIEVIDYVIWKGSSVLTTETARYCSLWRMNSRMTAMLLVSFNQWSIFCTSRRTVKMFTFWHFFNREVMNLYPLDHSFCWFAWKNDLWSWRTWNKDKKAVFTKSLTSYQRIIAFVWF